MAENELHVRKVAGESNPADLLTKGLPQELLRRHVAFAGYELLAERGKAQALARMGAATARGRREDRLRAKVPAAKGVCPVKSTAPAGRCPAENRLPAPVFTRGSRSGVPVCSPGKRPPAAGAMGCHEPTVSFPLSLIHI